MSTAQSQLTSEVLNRLMMAKYQLALAGRELASETEFGAWQASITAHDATETFLLALADHYLIPRSTRNNRTSLENYPKLLESATGVPFHDAAVVEDIVTVRNPSKHRGRYPGFADVQALVPRLRMALDSNARAYLGVGLAEISLAAMIADESVRALVKQAEEHIELGRAMDGMLSLKHAWLLVLKMFRDRFSAQVPPRLFRTLGGSASPEVGAIKHDLEEWWRRSQPYFEVALFGLDVVRYYGFESITPIVHLTEAGTPWANLPAEAAVLYTPASLNFALTFVIDSVVRLEETERLRQPGGYYTIRLKQQTSFYDAVKADYQNPAGELPAGTLIHDARFSLGPTAANSWTWREQSSGRQLVISFEAAEEVAYESRIEHDRRVRRLNPK